MSLKLVNLSKRYKDRWVLRDVSFEVSRGEIFGLFGPSDSGKTALLNVVLGRSATTTGAIYFDDRDLAKVVREERNFQIPEPADGSIWKRLLKKSKVASRGVRRVRSLNAAIDNARTVLLLDDPFAGLDAASRDAARQRLQDAVRTNDLAVLFASNSFEQIVDICDRAAVLVKGDIKQIGSPHDIYERPASRIVAEISGRNNLFAARRLTSSKAEIPEFQTIDGGHRLFAQRIERGALGALNQNVTLAIRPEQISISFGASFPADNLLKATIKEVRFRGPTTLIELDADGLHLEALVPRLVGLNPGDECMVGLPPDRILIFRD